LRFVTPGQRHRGEEIALLAQRHLLYEQAKARHPERWSGPTHSWTPQEIVYLNPGKSAKKEVDLNRALAQKTRHFG